MPQDWEVNTQGHWFTWNFGEAKLEIWLNDVEWFVFKDRTPSVVLVKLFNYSNHFFGMVSSTLHVYTIQVLYIFWEEKLPLSDPPTPSVLTPEDPEIEDSIADMAQRYKDTVRSDVIQGPKIEGKVEKEDFIMIWILDYILDILWKIWYQPKKLC